MLNVLLGGSGCIEDLFLGAESWGRSKRKGLVRRLEFQFSDEACRKCGSAEHDGAGPVHQHAVLGMPAHRLGQRPALNIAPDRNELIR